MFRQYDEPATSRMHIEYTADAIRIRWQRKAQMPEETQNADEGTKQPEESWMAKAEEGAWIEREIQVNFADRADTKNRLKQNLYELLSEETERLPVSVRRRFR